MGIRKMRDVARQAINDFLKESNITMADIYDLKRLKEEAKENAKEIVDLKVEVKVLKEKQLASEYKAHQLTKEEKEKIETKANNAVSMEDIVDSYKGDVQEFYPDGKTRNN